MDYTANLTPKAAADEMQEERNRLEAEMAEAWADHRAGQGD